MPTEATLFSTVILDVNVCDTKCSPKRNGKTDFQREVPLALDCLCKLNCSYLWPDEDTVTSLNSFTIS